MDETERFEVVDSRGRSCGTFRDRARAYELCARILQSSGVLLEVRAVSSEPRCPSCGSKLEVRT
jgi:hypothetical protein